METDYRAFDNEAGRDAGPGVDSDGDGVADSADGKKEKCLSVLRSLPIHLCYVFVATVVISILKWNLVNVPKEDKSQWAFHNVCICVCIFVSYKDTYDI